MLLVVDTLAAILVSGSANKSAPITLIENLPSVANVPVKLFPLRVSVTVSPSFAPCVVPVIASAA